MQFDIYNEIIGWDCVVLQLADLHRGSSMLRAVAAASHAIQSSVAILIIIGKHQLIKQTATLYCDWIRKHSHANKYF